jgi:hypothetical protein
MAKVLGVSIEDLSRAPSETKDVEESLRKFGYRPVRQMVDAETALAFNMVQHIYGIPIRCQIEMAPLFAALLAEGSMLDLRLTQHAEARMRQRGFRKADIDIVLSVATRIADDAFFLTTRMQRAKLNDASAKSSNSSGFGELHVRDEEKAAIRRTMDGLIRQRADGAGTVVLTNPVNIDIGTWTAFCERSGGPLLPSGGPKAHLEGPPEPFSAACESESMPFINDQAVEMGTSEQMRVSLNRSPPPVWPDASKDRHGADAPGTPPPRQPRHAP